MWSTDARNKNVEASDGVIKAREGSRIERGRSGVRSLPACPTDIQTDRQIDRQAEARQRRCMCVCGWMGREGQPGIAWGLALELGGTTGTNQEFDDKIEWKNAITHGRRTDAR